MTTDNEGRNAMTAHWQRPRDEHGRFAKPAAVSWNGMPTGNTYVTHEFVLGPQTNTCGICQRPWTHELHPASNGEPRFLSAAECRELLATHLDPPRAECSWWTDLEPAHRTTLLNVLPFVIALLGLGFGVAALIVGVQR